MVEQEWMKEVRALVGKEYGRVYGWDPVNAPMSRQWCEMMGVTNPIYTDAAAAGTAGRGAPLAPPTMLQVWCMEGPQLNNYPPGSTTENPYEALKLIEAQGYPATVAVNSELEFDRYLREGEKLYYTTRLDSVGEEKTTALGTGFFVTWVMTYFSQQDGGDEPVGQLVFRVFKFRPPTGGKAADAAPAASQASSGKPAAKRPPPGVSDDTGFFWEGARLGKLLIQRCKDCGTLRHPPGPVCSKCHSFEWDTLEASGRGSIYSFVVMHYPEVAPFEHPNPIGLIELEEGTRLVAQLVGVAPTALEIGQEVQVEFHAFDDNLVLPQFRPVAA